MKREEINILVIEDNPGDVRLLKEILSEARSVRFNLELADKLAGGLGKLSGGKFDVVLLDLSLPDSQGLATLKRLYSQTYDVPIVVLTGTNDETIAIQALQEGAQDFLFKEEISKTSLGRAIRYAIERHRLKVELRAMSLNDDLTSLYNRRGFLTLAQQQLKVADRTNTSLLLIFADLDGMKLINDTFGHKEGDNALLETANILRKIFRESDIIARIGGDEFAILALDTDDEMIGERVRQAMQDFNAAGKYPFRLSISMGSTRYEPKIGLTIDELLAIADGLMYQEKNSKKD